MKCALPGCDIEFTSAYKRQRFCCKKHQEKFNNQQAASRVGRKKKYKSAALGPSPRNKPVKYQPKPKRQLMTKEEQKKIDDAIDKKYAVKCQSRILKGAEFRQVAAELIERERRLGKRLEMRG